jgi:hypothetical protein
VSATTVVAAAVLALPATARAQAPAASPTAVTFTIFVRGTPIGSEQVGVQTTPDGGRIISGAGRLGAPLDILIRRLEITYAPDWRPLELTLETTVKGQAERLHTSVTGTSAQNEIEVNGVRQAKADIIDANALMLPNPIFAAYEALSARLRTAAVGATISAYIAPQGSMNIVVGESSSEKLQTLSRVIESRRTRVTLQPPAGPSVDVEVWGDENGRLLRVNIPTQAVDAVREDIGAVSTRRVTVSREGDEQVKVPANGFALAGTLSRPSNTPAGSRLPAVVLVGGSGPTDREETVAGIAIFGELANGLADAGFLVLRYDKRGVGQSGGRPESATMADFADDLRAAVRAVSDRRDVDRKRVAVVGYAEGGAVGLIAATREDRITAIALVAASGVTGAEFNMAQVTSALDRAKRPEAERESTIALQKKIQTAVLTGQGWDEIPPGLRKQADIPWFQSFLAYDPAQTMKDVKQPLLVVQGLLDTEVDPSNADKLDAMARARRRNPPVHVVKVPGVNHLLAAAKTGAVDEYGTLEEKRVSPLVVAAIVDWLKVTFAAVR